MFIIFEGCENWTIYPCHPYLAILTISQSIMMNSVGKGFRTSTSFNSFASACIFAKRSLLMIATISPVSLFLTVPVLGTRALMSFRRSSAVGLSGTWTNNISSLLRNLALQCLGSTKTIGTPAMYFRVSLKKVQNPLSSLPSGATTAPSARGTTNTGLALTVIFVGVSNLYILQFQSYLHGLGLVNQSLEREAPGRGERYRRI